MQPDLTPESLAELERLFSQEVECAPNPATTMASVPVVARVGLALLRAARERDELRDGPNGVAAMKCTVTRIWAALGNPEAGAYIWDHVAELRARAEKAEAERDAARRLVKSVLAVHDACAEVGRGVYEMHPDWVRDARVALAQKEPQP